MQTKIYVADMTQVELSRSDELFGERARQFERLKKTDDKKRCLASGILLNRLLPNVSFLKNKFGKPICDGNFCFNLSHSGNYVMLALSDCEIGCDIQKIKYQDFIKLGKIVFCENEMKVLETSVDKMGSFYDLWTKKESFLKCIGEGFHRPSKSVDVSESCVRSGEKMYFFKSVSFADYILCVCSEKSEIPDDIEFVNL